MDKKQEIIKELKCIMPCICLDAYKKIPRADPNCSWCGYGEDIVDLILEDRKKVLFPFKQLVNRLEEIHLDKRYEAVWVNYLIHGGKYTGPTYVDELNKAKESLKNAGISEKDG